MLVQQHFWAHQWHGDDYIIFKYIFLARTCVIANMVVISNGVLGSIYFGDLT